MKAKRKSCRAVRFSACPDCSWWSLGVMENGRFIRHSMGFGYVEKVGPGTRHPKFRTIICKGSGKFAEGRK